MLEKYLALDEAEVFVTTVLIDHIERVEKMCVVNFEEVHGKLKEERRVSNIEIRNIYDKLEEFKL